MKKQEILKNLQFKFINLNDSEKSSLHYKCEIYKGETLASFQDLLENKSSLKNIAKKNPLHGIAFVQKLAEAKDLEAIFIQCIYHTYKNFLVNGRLEPLDNLITLILERKQSDSFKSNLASYIKVIIEGNESLKEHQEAKELLNALMPGFEETILSDAYTLIEPQLVEIKNKTYSHHAFPDIIKYKNDYFIAFRAGKGHANYNDLGVIIILKGCLKKNEKKWEFEEISKLIHEEFDLRDPKFFVNHQNELMLVIGASKIDKKGKTVEMTPHIAKLEKEKWFLSPAILNKKKFKKGEWIWRVTYNPYDGFCYGISYGFDQKLSLLKSEDGISYTEITRLSFDPLDEPWNEVTIRFEKDGTMIALIRTERHGLIGQAKKENGYIDWDYTILPFHLGGPNFVMQPSGKLIAGTRYFFLNLDNTLDFATIAAYMDTTNLVPFLRFKSDEDNSYPGMVAEENGEITFLYYSGTKDSSDLFITRFMP